MFKILIVEDDKELSLLFQKVLEKSGYQVKSASDGAQALEVLDREYIDLIISDIMMPVMDGYELVSELRSAGYQIPVLMITAKSSFDDMRQGFLLGSDDYMVKPYSLRELEVRIQVLIRRYQSVGSSAASLSGGLDFSLLHIDKERHKAYYKKRSSDEAVSKETTSWEEIQLTNKEYDMLALLASSPGKVFTFEEIGNDVWGGYIESDRKTIMVTASRLRKKLALYQGLSKYIETVWSQGYQFIGEKK